jgi:3-deoxy-manno-octulosonate cytidylyltransferase (CMP-KDO synthetase)
LAATVIIPARFGSLRFPGKIVARDTGKPLVQHVVDRARACKRIVDVIVATDDQRIVDCLRPFGTRCVMTSPDHTSGTDRVAEVARGLPADINIIVNVQGDEPEIEPETIDGLVVRLAEHADEDMATAATVFPFHAVANDPNLVKVIMDVDGRAIYFSRSPIPFRRDPVNAATAGPQPPQPLLPPYFLHQGIYAYRRPFLNQFSGWPPTPLEQAEKLEQLRVLEHGRRIFVLKTARVVHGIDTPEQYSAFVKRYAEQQKSTQQTLTNQLDFRPLTGSEP